MPEYKDVSLIIKEIEEGKKNLHFKNAENAEICAGVLAFVQGVIDRVPEADVEPVKRGSWYMEYDFVLKEYDYHCCLCGENFSVKERFEKPPKYCLHCGAKMHSEEAKKAISERCVK